MQRELAGVGEESSTAEVAFNTISRLTITAKDKLSPIARSGISQLNVFMEEGSDLRKLQGDHNLQNRCHCNYSSQVWRHY